MTFISLLPAELLSEVLHYLPLRSLLAFASTSSNNYAFALSCLKTLEIGIYSSRKAALLADGQPLCPGDVIEEDASHRMNIIMSSRRCKTLITTIYHQNEIATDILNTHGTSLRSLDLSIWDLREETAGVLSKASGLRHLTLRMDHPHARVNHMPAKYWYTSPGSTVWNKLYASPSNRMPLTPPPSPPSSRCPSPQPPLMKTAVFTQLQTIHLERAGITDYQIHRIIQENPNLREIRLRKCFTLTDEFFRDLSQSDICKARRSEDKKGLKLLHFEDSHNASIDRRILGYITLMAGLQSLSLAGCSNLRNEQVREISEAEWDISDVRLPHAEVTLELDEIEIDPAYVY